ncbi:hypothetical protein [uncultured Mycolicibacterium sp.]|uniref:hypothetical protein n=1 Tax=uncultured Mycolicibacterium sp. TaxID=2320817 RepID=UPI002631B20E|nr:hypothetical protein [uncultured Mycolicibacterium sp.]
MKAGLIAAAVAAGACGAVLGGGLAAAQPDLVGQTYADATAALGEQGMKAVIGVVVGSRLPVEECVVINAQPISSIRPGILDESYEQYAPAEGEMQLTLDCNGDAATQTPTSAAAEGGREARDAEQGAAHSEEGTLAEVNTPNE